MITDEKLEGWLHLVWAVGGMNELFTPAEIYVISVRVISSDDVEVTIRGEERMKIGRFGSKLRCGSKGIDAALDWITQVAFIEEVAEA